MVRKGEIEGRIDCRYLQAVMTTSLKSQFETFPLDKLVSTVTGGTPDKSNPDYWNGEIFWVSPKDFNGLKISESEDTITVEGLKKSSSKFIEAENVLVVVRSGVLQHTLPIAVNKVGVAINQDIKALIIKDKSRLSPYYLTFYFNTFQKALLPLIVKNGATVQSINTEQFDKVRIPVPPPEIQKQVVNLFEEAYGIKQRKEAEAAALLASIDGYLLQALGITLPPPSAKQRFFYTHAQKVSGGRFDASFYDSKNQAWITALNNSTYPIKTLKEISIAIFQGVSQNLTDDDSTILLKVKNIAENNEIDFANVEFVKNAPIQKLLREGDIITPFIGEAIRKIKFSVFPLCNKQYTIDNNTGVIRLGENIASDYVAQFLATKAGAWQIERLIGGGVPFIGSNNAGKLIIPLPPLETQTAIANHISALRAQAKQLQQQAEAELAHAKQQVEKLILGETP